MDLIADLIRATDGGQTLERVDPSSPGGAVETRLALVLGRVQDALGTPVLQAKVPAPTESPIDRALGYREIATEGFTTATSDQDGASSDVTVFLSLGQPIPSSWNPALRNWDDVDGAAIRILTEGAEGTQAASAEYYLNVRPAAADATGACVVSVPVGGEGSADGVAVVFSPTRTRIRRIQPTPRNAAPGGQSCRSFRRLSANAFVYDLPLFDLDGSLDVRVQYEGDPPHVQWGRGILIRDGAPALVPVPSGFDPRGPLEPPPFVVGREGLPDLTTYGLDFDDAFERRVELVESATTFRDDKRFFLELERRTHPQIKPDFDPLGAALSNRYRRRGEYVHFGTEIPTSAEEVASKADVAQRVGRVLLQTILDAFGECEATGFERTGVAFDRFAGGELTIFETHGAPNGTNYFSFAELALLLVVADPKRRGVWEELFTIFARSAEIFVGAYHECCARRTRCAYRVANNPDGSRHPSDVVKDDLRTLWSCGDARRRYDHLVHSALYDDYVGAFGPNQTGIPSLQLVDFGC